MKKLVFIIFAVLVLIGIGWAIHTFEHKNKEQIEESATKQLVVEGDKALNIGRYADAKRVFEEELQNNPQNIEADWGMKKADVRLSSTGESLKLALDELYAIKPRDSHINLFYGDYYAAKHDIENARLYYEKAIELNPKLAEAHFGIAVLNEQQGALNSARVEYLKAIGLSPEARYQNSLATIYFKQQQFEGAVKEYGKNLEYPLSSLASAKIFWRLGYLSQALNYQRQAIELLENERVMAKPENQDAWEMEVDQEQTVRLVSLEEKKSYGYLSLSATLFLQGNAEEAEKGVQTSRSFKLDRQSAINMLLRANLDNLFQKNSEVLELIETFKKSYLQ